MIRHAKSRERLNDSRGPQVGAIRGHFTCRFDRLHHPFLQVRAWHWTQHCSLALRFSLQLSNHTIPRTKSNILINEDEGALAIVACHCRRSTPMTRMSWPMVDSFHCFLARYATSVWRAFSRTFAFKSSLPNRPPDCCKG